MKIRLKTRWVYGENRFTPACEKSEALFQLLTNRQYIKPSELTLLGKMGYELELVGDTHELSKELEKHDMELNRREDGVTVLKG